MSAAVLAQPASAAKADPREVFELRCWARAHLYAAGELELHEAVDVLQRDAVASGLVRAIGQNEVQFIMGSAFGWGRK